MPVGARMSKGRYDIGGVGCDSSGGWVNDWGADAIYVLVGLTLTTSTTHILQSLKPYIAD